MFKFVLIVLMTILPPAAGAKSIVVFGDSISAAYGMEIQQGWVALLQKKLADRHSPYAIHNQSISGETSAEGLARLDGVLQRDKPDLLLLELGANDGLRGLSPQAMKSNLTEIVKRSQRAGARVLLLAMKIPPNYGKRYIALFYDIYPELAAELHIPWVPFILEDVVLKPEMMQPDGLHPNALGQPAIAERVWTYLQPLL